jgi:hypothetical protein
VRSPVAVPPRWTSEVTMRLAALGSFAIATLLLGACAVNTVPWDNGNGGSKNGNGQTPDTDGGGNSGDQDAAQPQQDSGGNPPPQDAGAPPQDSGTVVDSGNNNSPFDQFQQHNLDVVNQYRKTLNIAPLVLDTQLCTFAQAGSVELSQDHSPHQHFINAGNNNTLWTSGFKTTAGENQGDPNGWYVMSNNPTTNELDQIDDIQLQMFNEGPGTGEAHGHYMNMMNSKFKRLGVGLLEVNGELYLTNDFSD